MENNEKDTIMEAVETAGEVDMQDTPQADSEDSKDAITEDSSTSEAQQSEESASAGESAAEESQESPTEDRSKSKVGERIGKLSRSNKELKSSLEQQRLLNEQLQGRLQGLENMVRTPQQPQTSLTPEQIQAKEQLDSILGIKEMRDTLDQLKTQNAQLTQSQQTELFEREEKSISQTVEKHGLLGPDETMDDVLDTLEEHIKKSPFLSQFQGKPGVFTAAFKDLYFDRQLELGKKSASKEIVDNRKKAISQQSERTSPSSSAPGKPLRDVTAETVRLINAAGGEDNIEL